jgi:hypothetical protein
MFITAGEFCEKRSDITKLTCREAEIIPPLSPRDPERVEQENIKN